MGTSQHIASQIVELAEKYAPDTAWYIRVMAEVRPIVYVRSCFLPSLVVGQVGVGGGGGAKSCGSPLPAKSWGVL
jgi:hypothetical protein